MSSSAGSARYCSSSSSAGAAVSSSVVSFLALPSRPLRLTLRCFLGGSLGSSSGAGVGTVAGGSGSSLPPGAPSAAGGGATGGRGFHTVDHSVRSSRSAHALSLGSMRSKPSRTRTPRFRGSQEDFAANCPTDK